MTGSSDHASDVVQEVFVSLFDKLKNGYVIQFQNTWLYRATIYKCCDVLRRQKHFEPLESAVNCPNETELTDKSDTAAIVQKALLGLTSQERGLAILYSEGLSYKELADATGIKLTSIGKTLSRVLDKLEKELKKLNYELY
jgi:RNA polymerase sigma-70 factor (ECF subfamily)